MNHLELNFITLVHEISHKICHCGFNLNVLSLFIVIPPMNYVVNNHKTSKTFIED